MDLINAFIHAWANYEEDRFMDVCENYLRHVLKNYNWSAWWDLKEFHNNYRIRVSYDGSNYIFINRETGEIVKEVDYPKPEDIIEIANLDT